MTQVNGEVVGVDSKVITSKNTGKKFRVHYVELDTGDRVNVGFNNPFKVGQVFAAEVEEKYGELKLASKGGSPTGGSSGDRTSGPTFTPRNPASGRPFPIPKTSGEMAIIRQNALTNSVTMFCNGALEFVENKDDMKTVDELIEEVIKMAYKFAEFSSGNREVAMAADMQKKAAKRTRKVVVEDEEDAELEDEVE